MLFRKKRYKNITLKLEEYSKKMNLFPTSISYRKNKEHGVRVIIKMV